MDPILQIIHRTNQRGGTILSLIHLILAQTLTPSQAAWLLHRIETGHSWIVGAKPGGAGKTTVMSALLAHLPPEETTRLANPDTDWQNSQPGQCVVACEIGPGHYDAYIWGKNVAHAAQLALQGTRIVTNLHADTLQQARAQIVDDCHAAPQAFDALHTFIPITIRHTPDHTQRRVETIHYHHNGQWKTLDATTPPTPRQQQIAQFLHQCLRENITPIEAVRNAWIQWTQRHPAPPENNPAGPAAGPAGNKPEE